jgi:hypothetical protein
MTHSHDGGLRFVDASDLDSRVLVLEDLDVVNSNGDDLGEVDGFLVDADSGRPLYVLVDSGGWFHSRRYAVPVGLVHYDGDLRALRVDLTRDTINRFPAFDEKFDSWSADRWRQYDQGVTSAARPPSSPLRDDAGVAMATWWQSNAWTEFGHATGRRDIQRDYATEAAARREAAEEVSREDFESPREAILARDDDRVDTSRAADDTGRAPRYGERAQPGDVLGIESAGETTGIGETAEDEDRRRERAERDIEDLDLDEDRRDRR